MPELPEVETLRRSLEPVLIGQTIERFTISRANVVRPECEAGHSIRAARSSLIGSTVVKLLRRGKQLAIVTDRGPAMCIHLGMSGQLMYLARGQRLRRTDHVHCTWRLRNEVPSGRMTFRDPRRFGGVWVYPSLEGLIASRWSLLGPDALEIGGRDLRAAMGHSRRPIKAALLDQSTIAGVGNIYADESLHQARINPLTGCIGLSESQWLALARAIRRTLQTAVECGGSTFRDYRDGLGRRGDYVARHRVYGRAGLPCRRCQMTLVQCTLAQRTTVFCPRCQQS